MIRKATVADVKDIQGLVNSHADKGEMLPRSLGDTCDNIRDFWIYEMDGVMLGCCALHVTWVDLAEIKSLAVVDDAQGKGVGTKLMDGCLSGGRSTARHQAGFCAYLQALVFPEKRLSEDRQGGTAS